MTVNSDWFVNDILKN